MGAGESTDHLADAIAGLSLGGQDEQTDTCQQEVQDVPGASVALKTLAYWILKECTNVVILSGAGVCKCEMCCRKVLIRM